MSKKSPNDTLSGGAFTYCCNGWTCIKKLVRFGSWQLIDAEQALHWLPVPKPAFPNVKLHFLELSSSLLSMQQISKGLICLLSKMNIQKFFRKW